MRKMNLDIMMMRNIAVDSPFCDIDIEAFCTNLETLSEKHGLLSKIQVFTKEIQSKPKNDVFRKDASFDSFWLTPDMENDFFSCLLGKVDVGTRLTKYTTSKVLIIFIKINKA